MMRQRWHVKRALLQLVCALFLLAQHLGLSHAVLHAYKQLPAQHQNGAQNERRDAPDTPSVSKLCAFDALFGQVLGAAPPTADLCRFGVARGETEAQAVRTLVVFSSFVPLSRGPPAFL
jgi:hypothetical protein